MLIERKRIKVGDRVRCIQPIEIMRGTFEVGTEFEVIGESRRGYDLLDDVGNNAIEVSPLKLELVQKFDSVSLWLVTCEGYQGDATIVVACSTKEEARKRGFTHAGNLCHDVHVTELKEVDGYKVRCTR